MYQFFWDVTLLLLAKSGVSKDTSAVIFSVKQGSDTLLGLADLEDEDTVILRNVGSPFDTVTSQNT
jgi:hypothetical protein